MSSSAIALLFAGLGIGVVGSLHCVGMCGPFAALAGSKRGLGGVIPYSAGRLVTYALLGAVAGTVGGALSGLRTVGLAVSVVIIVAVSLQMAGVLPEPRWAGRIVAPLVRWGSRAGRAFPPLLGASTALLPCGLVYAGLGVAVTAGSAALGALVMVAFGLGTWPALIAVGLGFGRVYRSSLRVRRVMAVAVAVAGLWAVGHRVPAHDAESLESAVPSCCRGDEGPQAPAR